MIWDITKPIPPVQMEDWALVVFACGFFEERTADYWANRIEEFLLDSQVDDCALSDRAGCGFNGDGEHSDRGSWDEDIAHTRTARNKADGEDEGAEQTEETERALLAG